MIKFIYILVFCGITSTAAAQYLHNPRSAASGDQLACARRSNIVRNLEVKYQEELIAIGLADTGRLIEVFASNSGSFTILLSYPNGYSCVAASGEGWRTVGRGIK